MTRSISAPEISLITGTSYQVFGRVRIEDPDGALRDLTTLAGLNWVQKLVVEQDIDEPVAQANITLRRDYTTGVGLESIAPLRVDSTLNRNGAGAYAPLVDVGRRLVVDLGVAAVGSAVVAWNPVFDGYIDRLNDQTPAMALVARDAGGQLVDTWTTSAVVISTLTPIQTVMQQVLDNTFGAGVVPLYVPVDPGISVSTFKWDYEPVMDVLKRLSDSIGWDVRYRWDSGTSSFRLTLSQPPRTKTVPDITYGPGLVRDVSSHSLDRIYVRNDVTIVYGSGSPRPRYQTTDASSILRYKRRPVVIEEGADSMINSLFEATRLGDAILLDLKDPKAEMDVQLHLDYRVELWDLLRFTADGIRFSADQDLAVSKVAFSLGEGEARTKLSCRGTPAGAYVNWLARANGDGISEDFVSCTAAILVPSPASDAKTIQRMSATYGGPGVGTVRIKSMSANCSISTGPAVGSWVASGQIWKINRPTDGATGEVVFESQSLAGTDEASMPVPAVGNDSPILIVSARILTNSVSAPVYRIFVSHSGSSTATVTLTATATGVGVSGDPLPFSVAAGVTAFADYTVTVPSLAQPQGRIVWVATATGFIKGQDSANFGDQGKDFTSPVLTLSVVADADPFVVGYTTDAPTVAYSVNGGGSWTSASGGSISVARSSSQQILLVRATSVGGIITTGWSPIPSSAMIGGGAPTAVIDRVFVSSVDTATDTLNVGWSYSGTLGTGYFDVLRVSTLGLTPDLSGTATSIATTSGTTAADSSHGFDLTAGGSNVTFSYMVRVFDSSGNVLRSSSWIHYSTKYT